MSNLKIYPYKMSSMSSKQLRDRLGALRVYPDRAYRYRDGDLVINWGNTQLPTWDNSQVKWLNNPVRVRNASNKLTTLKMLDNAGIKVPQFTTDMDRALLFDTIVVRHSLTGHSGQGIEIIDGYDHYIPNAPLYTEYIPAKAEYRVHIFDGNVIDISKKVRMEEPDLGYPPVPDEPDEEEMMIKSHKNGWMFARGGINFNPELGRIAIKAVKTLGLDFGAVDIIRGEDNEYYTLEVNTACGMETSTENSYVTAILNYIIKHE